MSHPRRARLVARAIRTSLALAVAAVTVGCAGPAAYDDPVRDPLKPINRPIHKFNMGFDRFFLRPIVVGYDFITPDPLQIAFNNFFDNLASPTDIINALLQGKFARAGVATGRLVMNSTLGLGGLMDPATHAGLKPVNEDFGQTMAVWGIPPGPYIVIPFLGPASFRDGVGFVGDLHTSPLFDFGISVDVRSGIRDKAILLRLLQLRANFLDQDEALREAFDSYVFLRDVYAQRRNYVIFDGNPPEEEPEDVDDWADEE